MTVGNNTFDEHAVLHELKHFLPALSPGGKFTYQNPLRAFQHQYFHDALRQASEMLGYRTTLSLEEYRSFYNSKRVKPEILEKVLVEKKGAANTFEWQDKVLMKKFPADAPPRIGMLRTNWKKNYKTDLNARVHPRLFRILSNYLDQGTSDWQFPVRGQGFLDSMREVESKSFVSIFNTPRARKLLLDTRPSISDLLTVVIGDETLFRQYLFDQQFAHRGWSGWVTTLEGNFQADRTISLHDLVIFELLLEIDVLDDRLGKHWQPLAERLTERPENLFKPVPATEKSEVLAIWQEAFEWSCYDRLLAGFNQNRAPSFPPTAPYISETVPDNAPRSVCIVGGRSLIRNIPPGHRALLNAYDYSIDPEGEMLDKILETAVPSLGAANLEYFFSRTSLAGEDQDYGIVDQIMGIFPISNSARRDLSTGLPPEIAAGYDPLRLLCVVEQVPGTVLKVVNRLGAARSWFLNGWIHLVVIDPVSHELRVMKNGRMVAYKSDRRVTETAV